MQVHQAEQWSEFWQRWFSWPVETRTKTLKQKPETQTFPLTACVNTYVHSRTHKSFHHRGACQWLGQRLVHFPNSVEENIGSELRCWNKRSLKGSVVPKWCWQHHFIHLDFLTDKFFPVILNSSLAAAARAACKHRPPPGKCRSLDEFKELTNFYTCYVTYRDQLQDRRTTSITGRHQHCGFTCLQNTVTKNSGWRSFLFAVSFHIAWNGVWGCVPWILNNKYALPTHGSCSSSLESVFLL